MALRDRLRRIIRRVFGTPPPPPPPRRPPPRPQPAAPPPPPPGPPPPPVEGEYFPDPFEGWTRAEQQRWIDMVQSSGRPDMMNDAALRDFYDIAFNTPKGQMAGDDRAAIMDALRDYMQRTYGISFDRVFDWASWRAALGY